MKRRKGKREEVAEGRAETDASLDVERATADAAIRRAAVNAQQHLDILITRDRVLADRGPDEVSPERRRAARERAIRVARDVSAGRRGAPRRRRQQDGRAIRYGCRPRARA